MTLAFALVAVPTLGGAVAWLGWRRRETPAAALAAWAAVLGVTTLGLAVGVLIVGPQDAVDLGAGLMWSVAVTPVAGVMAVAVAAVSLPVVVYAAVHEERAVAPRVTGLLLVFVGAMQLLVVAGDLVTLLVGWELVGAVSWALVATEWREPGVPGAANTAFLATRAGDLGLFAAVGAAVAGAGGVAYADLAAVDGGALHLLVAGIGLAAISKGAQLPFSPWLDAAMAGPTPASALLHSATMVAAGPYLLVRLSDVVGAVDWFGPAAVAVGLATALAAGVVASTRTDVKRLLAASTSAQVGLMVVAVGVGAPLVAFAHLLAHATLKALLFLAGGVAIAASGGRDLRRMRLGRALPVSAGMAGVGALALAAVWPLGAAWTKEHVVAAAGGVGVGLALLVVLAGGLSAAYAARWWLLAFGTAGDQQGGDDGGGDSGNAGVVRAPSATERAGVGVLAALTLAASVLWWPGVGEALAERLGGQIPSGAPWELVASLSAVAIAVYAVWTLDRRGRLQGEHDLAGAPWARRTARWAGWPDAVGRLVVAPSMAGSRLLARADDRLDDAVTAVGRGAVGIAGRLARGDDRVVDAGVRGVGAATSWLAAGLTRVGEGLVDGVVAGIGGIVGQSGRDARRLQTGMTHHYYVIVVVGVAAATVVVAVLE